MEGHIRSKDKMNNTQEGWKGETKKKEKVTTK